MPATRVRPLRAQAALRASLAQRAPKTRFPERYSRRASRTLSKRLVAASGRSRNEVRSPQARIARDYHQFSLSLSLLAAAAGSQSMHNVVVPARRQPRQELPQRKSDNLRVMLSSLRLTFTPIRSDDDDSVSPGSSVSSQSTSISTNSSSCSLESSTRECVRNGIRRTDPYGPPYYARAPVPVSGSRGGRSSTSSLSSVGISSLAVSEASSTSGVPGMMPPDAAHLPGTLSAAAAIADAARKGRLRDTMAVGCDSRP